MKKSISIITLALLVNISHAQEFKILADNWGKRRDITHTVSSGGFIIGVNEFGGGYITQVHIPGIGNIMGVQAQKYGRGGQSSIRDMGRGGQYNPTQAGFSDKAGTECRVTQISPKKIIIPTRGAALFNGDGGYDYIASENITEDPYNEDGGNTDIDGIDESNLSVTINGQVFTQQEAEVHSDFDFYAEYEDYAKITGTQIPAIRHYFEYRFIRSSTLPNAAMKQFNEAGLKAAGKWNDSKFLDDISVENPVGIHPGGLDNLNSIILSWSIRNDVDIWDPKYLYRLTQMGEWSVQERGERQNQGKSEEFKLQFIVADSDNENVGRAIGFYLPESDLNIYNIVGIRESDNSEVYVDNRTSSNFYLDGARRTPLMSWIGFRSELNGLIDRSKLTGEYEGVYEKLRQETIMVVGNPAEIKAAFTQLDTYYAGNYTPPPLASAVLKDDSFRVYPNPVKRDFKISLKSDPSKIFIHDINGRIVYSAMVNKELLISKQEIGTKGIYFITINDTTQKLIIE